MKKTLQINIGGLSFSVEEEAYHKLSQYLQSIQKYFSSYESCEEITADIEARIAEKFFQKTEKGGIIEMDDVNKIMQSMGSVADFEAVKEDEDLSKPNTSKFDNTTQTNSQYRSSIPPNTSFYRDSQRKALGGVLAGIAHRFEFDVVWARILFIICSFGLVDNGLGGIFILAYIICWIVFPERSNLEENKKIKKFYRSPENKVLGGVASGLSSYLGIDLVVVRIIFVVTGFLFVGIFIYIIFWIVAPNALSLTQKMELKGQPLTLENIETSIKSNNLNEGVRPESSISKLLLFPFRIIGIVIKALGHVLKSFGPIVRILAGLMLLFLGSALAISILFALGAFFGLITHDTSWLHGKNIFKMIANDFPPIGGVFAFLVAFIPAISLTILGISLISNQRHGNSNFWLTALALWFGGLVGSAAIGSKYAMNFSKKQNFEKEVIFNLPSKTLVLHSFDNDEDFEMNANANVVVETSENADLKVISRFSAKGSTKNEALLNAQNIEYVITQKDSALVFPRNFIIKGKNILRDQHVESVIYIPANRNFKMTEEFAFNILGNRWELDSKYGINRDDIDKYTFHLDTNDDIICNECPQLTEEEREARNNHDNFNGDFIDDNDFSNLGHNQKTLDIKNFENLEIGANFIALVKYAPDTKLEVYADNEDDLKDVEAKNFGNTLTIKYDDPFENRNSKVNLVISSPNVKDLDISGAAILKLIGFGKTQKLNVKLTGASKAAIELNAENLNVEASGASKLVIKGEAKSMDIALSGACHFEGKDLKATNAKIHASGASKANISKIENLKTEISGGSQVNKN